MEIIFDMPPNLAAIKAAGLVPTSNTVFCYDGKLYNPGRHTITRDLMIHETVHAQQQHHFFGGADGWWDRYLRDPVFRLSQETEAYQAQFRYYRGTHKNVKKQAIFLSRLAKDLSGSTYGNMISFQSAMALLNAE